jgi:hypothetical protein
MTLSSGGTHGIALKARHWRQRLLPLRLHPPLQLEAEELPAVSEAIAVALQYYVQCLPALRCGRCGTLFLL